jgi:copper chaperone CopZ
MVIFLNVTKFHVDNLKGTNDIKNLRGELQSLDGVHAVRVDDVADTITVEYEDGLNTEMITSAINKYKNVRH